MVRPRARGALLAAPLLAAALWAGCGDDARTRFREAEDPRRPGGGGRLAYAIPASPGDLDPLSAATASERTVARQIFEPLVASLDGPYRRRAGVPGVALSARHSGDFRVWSLRLRRGVRFQDGGLLNASAVVENAERWRTSAAGRRLLPGLVAADGPRPNLVRFVFSEPVRNVATRLSDPRLGIVSPTALRPGGERGALMTRVRDAGNGPFQLRSRSGERVDLARNRGWWGSPEALGPALEGVEFRIVPARAARLAMLRAGDVQVAAAVGAAAAQLRGDPLLTSVGGTGAAAIGVERSLRGFDGRPEQSLSEVWIAAIDR